MRPRLVWVASALYAALLGVLVVAAPRQTVGDGGEYLSYALSFARFEGPAMTTESFREITAEIQTWDPGFGVDDLESRSRARRDEELEFLHFWLYSALAAPAVAVVRLVGLDPRHGFVVFNVALMVLAFFLMCRRFGAPVAVFLATGPILWWADKAHPEAMLFSLTFMAFSLWMERPALALLCAGALGAQVPPYGVLIPLFAVAILYCRPNWRPDRTLLLAIAGAIALALAAPAHYLFHFGRSSLLAGGGAGTWTWPSIGEISTPIGDLNIGLFPNHPLLLVAMVTALLFVARDWRRLRRVDIGIAFVAVVILLMAFPQIRNWTHGGTPGVSRFAVWLIPFALPLLVAPAISALWMRVFSVLALGSVIYGVAYFAPSVTQLAHRSEPSWIARQVWHHAPSWSRPLPLVFAGIVKPHKTTMPIAASGCGKVLLVGRGEVQGMWPRPCFPAPVAPACREPGRFCWANRTADGYVFEVVTEETPAVPYDPASVWPREAEGGIRTALDSLGWSRLGELRPRERDAAIRGIAGATFESALAGPDRLFVVLQDVHPGASIVFSRQPGRVTWLDAATGATIEENATAEHTASGWALAIPNHPRVVIVISGLTVNAQSSRSSRPSALLIASAVNPRPMRWRNIFCRSLSDGRAGQRLASRTLRMADASSAGSRSRIAASTASRSRPRAVSSRAMRTRPRRLTLAAVRTCAAATRRSSTSPRSARSASTASMSSAV